MIILWSLSRDEGILQQNIFLGICQLHNERYFNKKSPTYGDWKKKGFSLILNSLGVSVLTITVHLESLNTPRGSSGMELLLLSLSHQFLNKVVSPCLLQNLSAILASMLKHSSSSYITDVFC